MGAGAWSSVKYRDTVTTMGFSSTDAIVSGDVNQSFTQSKMDEKLNPYQVTRECCNTEEHPNTIPIMLCVDCTGSMGNSLKNCFASLDKTITSLLEKVKDVEICVVGIGDFAYDRAPFQVSQYESDNRILDWLLKIYQEKGGGGNSWESYTAPWYFGLRHTKLDCWEQGRKGIIISLGDEGMNPYLPQDAVKRVFGDDVQDDIDTEELYKEAAEKFDIYHIAITDEESSFSWHSNFIKKTWEPLLKQRLIYGKSSELPQLIVDIVNDSQASSSNFATTEISW